VNRTLGRTGQAGSPSKSTKKGAAPAGGVKKHRFRPGTFVLLWFASSKAKKFPFQSIPKRNLPLKNKAFL
jgi:hypothetical protein